MERQIGFQGPVLSEGIKLILSPPILEITDFFILSILSESFSGFRLDQT
jgi:hypothetical protein